MSNQQPIQCYYPSARVRLIIRLEDYGSKSVPKPPKVLPQLRRGKKSKSPDSLRIIEQDGALLLVGPGDNPSAIGSPQQQQASGDNLTHVIDGIIPITAAHSQNGIRIADTLNLELEFADFPIDPRAIRSCAVQYFLGTVTPDDFQRGINGELRANETSNGVRIPYNVVPDTYTDSNGKQRTNLRFEGWVDSWQAEWPDGSSPKVVLECTDNTRILIEQDHPSRLALSVDVPLDRAVAEYLSNFPQFRGLSVAYAPLGQTAPTIKASLTKQAYPPGVGPSAAMGGDSKLSVWDYLTDICKSVGHFVRLEGTTVVIQQPRTLFNSKFPPRADDPFQGREIDSLGAIPNRLMIYGQNIQSMNWNREFGKYSPLNIEIRSYNPRRKKTLIARFPQVDKRTQRINPGEGTDQKFEVISIPGIQDEAVLRAIAQQLYEVLGRNEIFVNVVTKNLGSFGGGNLDPDLLDARVGDAIDVVIQRGDLSNSDHNTVTTVQGELAKRPAEFLIELGYPEAFADAYAKTLNNVGFQTTFRIKELHTDWDKAAEGVRLDFDVVNYVEVRADAELPAGEEQVPNASNATSKKPIIVTDEIQ